MFINSNIDAMSTILNFNKTDVAFSKSLHKISTGLELPKPEFGGGFFAIANDMEALYRNYVTGAKNSADAIGLLEVAQTVMLEVNSMILDLGAVAQRAATDTLTTAQRTELLAEHSEIRLNITSLVIGARFNDKSIWGNGGLGATNFSIVVGRSTQYVVSTYGMSAASLAYSNVGWAGGTQASAVVAVNFATSAVEHMSILLAKMGAQVAKIEAKTNILNEQAVQQKAIESRINELDFATEMKNFTSLQVIMQASNAMVAQANLKTQIVLQLFA